MTAPLWLWRMKHPAISGIWGLRVERLLTPDAPSMLYASFTFDNVVVRTSQHLCVVSGHTLDELLRWGETFRAELLKEGCREVEDDG